MIIIMKNRQGRFQYFARGCKVFPEMRLGGRQRNSGVCGRTSATPLKPHLNMYFHNKTLGPLKGTLHFRNNLGSKDSLNNEFVLKIRYLTPITKKNPQTFLAKILKVTFREVLALWCINTKIS